MLELNALTIEERTAITKELVEELIRKQDELVMVTHWGEPSLLVCDVINIVNNVMKTDYKRYTSYSSRMNNDENNPQSIKNPICLLCNNYWRNQKDFQGCLGIENNKKKPCEKYESRDI